MDGIKEDDFRKINPLKRHYGSLSTRVVLSSPGGFIANYRILKENFLENCRKIEGSDHACAPRRRQLTALSALCVSGVALFS